MNKIKKIILFFLTLLLVVYLILLFFPEIAFGNKVQYKSFIIYSHSQVDRKIFTILDRAESLIDSSELHKIKTGKNKLYLCNSFIEYFFFAPTQKGAFACNNPLTGKILISKSNILQNYVERNDSENNFRTLSGTIAHEVTHSLMKKHLGFIRYIQLDTWINEGYSDFIAKESSFDYKNGMTLLCNYENSSQASFKYFKYRLYIEYLINTKKITFNQILKSDFDLTQLEKNVRQKYCP